MTAPQQPEPVWDGTGIDPWLPARLAVQATIAAAERAVYAETWAELSRWLVTTSRRVLATSRPDPQSVWAGVPDWQAAVNRIVTGPIRDIIASAYAPLLGEGYQFDQRPAVVEHLAMVTNRMVDTPDQVFDLVVGEVAKGSQEGESIPEIAARVEEVLSTTGTERWPNRAVVVARTETLSALNAGRDDAWTAVAEELEDDEDDFELERFWLATSDDRTRRTHREAEGQRSPVGGTFTVGEAELRRPGDPLGPPEEIIQCLRGDTIVEFGSVRAITRRWYEGEMVELCFASGNKLAVTPNHPILRADGRWTSAHLLDEGDDCVGAFSSGRLLGQPYEHRGPSEVCELYRAASESQRAQRVRVSPPDFHGDGFDGYVEVVSVDGELGFNGYAAGDQQVNKFGLALADLAASSECSTERGALTSRIAMLHRDCAHANGGVRRRCELSTLISGESLHAQTIGVTAPAYLYSSGRQSPDDRRPTNADRSGESLDAFARDVPAGDVLDVHDDTLRESICLGDRAQLDACVAEKPCDRCNAASICSGKRWGAFASQVATSKLVSINRYRFAGHVYNLDTGVGWYIGNCIVVRNCRCTTLLVERGEDVDLSNRQFRNY